MAKNISTILNLKDNWTSVIKRMQQSTSGFRKVVGESTIATKVFADKGAGSIKNFERQIMHTHNQMKIFGGGISNTLKSTRSSLLNFGLGLAAGSLNIKAMATNAQAAQKATAQMSAVLKSTGGAAGLTQKQLTDLAATQSRVTTYSKGTTIAAENLLLTFTKIGKQTFPDTIKAAQNMSTSMGTSLNSSVLMLGKALNSPADGLSKLTRNGVTFSDSQQKMIKSMQATGNIVGAQKLMLQELNKEFGGSAEAAAKTIPGQIEIIKHTFSGLGATITTLVVPYLTNLTNWLGEKVPAGVAVLQKVIPKAGVITSGVFKSVASVASATKVPLEGLLKSIGNFAKASGITNLFKNLFSGVNTGVLQKVKDLLVGLLNGTKSFVDYCTAHIETVKILFIGLGSTIAAIKIGGMFLSAKKGIEGVVNAGRGLNGLSKFSNIFAKIFKIPPQMALFVAGTALVGMAAYLIIKNWTPIKQFFSNTFTSIKNTVNSAYNTITSKINGFIGVLKNHQTAIRNAAIILGTIFGPALIKSGTQAAIAGSKIAGSFIANIVKTGTQAAIAGGKVAISFTGNLIKSGVQAVIAAGKITGSFIASMVKSGLQAGITGAKIMGSLVKSMVSYAAAGWRAVGSIAAFTGGIVRQGAIAVINAARIAILKTATLAVSAAQKIAAGTQAALNFVMNMNPLVRIVTVIFSLVGALVVLYNKNVWFKNKVNAVFAWFKTLPAKFKGWAHDMINGFVKGIEEKFAPIKKAAKGIADIVKKFLHFSKPDEGPLTTYETWMPDFVNGMSTGMKNTTPNIYKTTSSMTSGMGTRIRSFTAQCNPLGVAAVNQLRAGIANSGAQSSIMSTVKTLTAKVINAFKNGFGIHSPSRVFFKLGNYIVQGFVNGLNSKDMGGFIKNWVGNMTSAAGSVSGNVSAWLAAALGITGTPLSWLPGLSKLVQAESGGNPAAYNGISVGGEHATGLLQTLPSTFMAYAVKGMTNILNPIANAAAAINYIKSTYGSVYNTPLFKGGTYVGYANGGIASKPSIFGEAGTEIAIPLKPTNRSKQLLNTADEIINGGSGKGLMLNVTVNVQGNMIGNEDFANSIGQYIYKKVMDARKKL